MHVCASLPPPHAPLPGTICPASTAGTHVMCTMLSPSACARQVAPLRISAQAAGLAASTAFNPVSARFAPAAGCPQAGSMVPMLSPAGQPPSLGEASTPGLTPCATLPAPGMRAGAPAQQGRAKVAGFKSHCVPNVSSPVMYLSCHFSGHSTCYSASRHAHACTFASLECNSSRAEHALSSKRQHTHTCYLQGPKGEHTATTNRAATFTNALVPTIDDVCSSILQV